MDISLNSCVRGGGCGAYVEEGADVEGEMFGCHVCALGSGENGEYDAVRGFKDFKEVVVTP